MIASEVTKKSSVETRLASSRLRTDVTLARQIFGVNLARRFRLPLPLLMIELIWLYIG